ncbi:MAG: response regulator [Bacteroidetes bacterium]|nr:response regulator [Bacteroidota bacterium]
MIKILIVDDHQIFRDSISLLLDYEHDMEVVGQASNGKELLEILKTIQPNLILMDISMHEMGGVETSHLVKRLYPKIKILILSMNSEHQNIIGAMEAGVNGYLLKSAGKKEVLMAIRAVTEGSSYFSNEVSVQIVQQLTQVQNPKKVKVGEVLSSREIEVLSLIARQYSSAEIGEKLFISARTVDSHRRNMLDKLGLKNAAGLVRYALENGIS